MIRSCHRSFFLQRESEIRSEISEISEICLKFSEIYLTKLYDLGNGILSVYKKLDRYELYAYWYKQISDLISNELSDSVALPVLVCMYTDFFFEIFFVKNTVFGAADREYDICF